MKTAIEISIYERHKLYRDIARDYGSMNKIRRYKITELVQILQNKMNEKQYR